MTREQIDQTATDAATLWIFCASGTATEPTRSMTRAEFAARQAADAYAATLGVTA